MQPSCLLAGGSRTVCRHWGRPAGSDVCPVWGQWSEVHALCRDEVSSSPKRRFGLVIWQMWSFFFFLPSQKGRKKKKKSHTEWEVVSGEYGLRRLKIKQEERAPLGSRAQLYMVKTHVNFLKSSTLIFFSSSLSPRHQNLPSDLLYIGVITMYP